MWFGSPFLPESPRWLCEVGRVEDAVKSLERLRSGRGDARAEALEIQQALRAHQELTGGTSWRQLFRGSNRLRTIITVGMTCLQQGMGISMVSGDIHYGERRRGVLIPLGQQLLCHHPHQHWRHPAHHVRFYPLGCPIRLYDMRRHVCSRQVRSTTSLAWRRRDHGLSLDGCWLHLGCNQ
jgi:hypothetical protein